MHVWVSDYLPDRHLFLSPLSPTRVSICKNPVLAPQKPQTTQLWVLPFVTLDVKCGFLAEQAGGFLYLLVELMRQNLFLYVDLGKVLLKVQTPDLLVLLGSICH